MRRDYETFHQKFGNPKKSCVVPSLRAVTCSSLEPPEAWRRQMAFEENLAPGCFSSPRRRQWSVPWGNLSEVKQVPYVTTYNTTTPFPKHADGGTLSAACLDYEATWPRPAPVLRPGQLSPPPCLEVSPTSLCHSMGHISDLSLK